MTTHTEDTAVLVEEEPSRTEPVVAPRAELAAERRLLRRVPFHRPWMGPEEERAVVEALRSGWVTAGPKTRQFEEQFAIYVGARHAIALNSCTAGLHLSLIAHDVGTGDEVITSPITFAATANVIEHVGAKPVFVDVEPDTLNIDPRKLARAVTPRTRAVIPVHFGGHCRCACPGGRWPYRLCRERCRFRFGLLR